MKNITLKILLILGTCLLGSNLGLGQCASEANIYSFVYDGITYEVVRENKRWSDAVACAVERGGMLAEINDEAEQNAIFAELDANAGIDVTKTVSPDGKGSYVWIGGNDLATEGKWIWDGNNDKSGAQFWMGTFSGTPVGGLYNNWGDEPDDFEGQDALGLAVTHWPLGMAGQWNDVDHTNSLYYLIEYSSGVGIEDNELYDHIKFYPTPVKEFLVIEYDEQALSEIVIFSLMGQKLKSVAAKNTSSQRIDLSSLNSGIYLVKVNTTDGRTITQKIVK